jgi:hypothetical protein
MPVARRLPVVRRRPAPTIVPVAPAAAPAIRPLLPGALAAAVAPRPSEGARARRARQGEEEESEDVLLIAALSGLAVTGAPRMVPPSVQRRATATTMTSSYQPARLAYAVQHPYDSRAPSVVDLLLPSANLTYCPVLPAASPEGVRLASESSRGTLYGRALGAGGNATVYALDRPATASDVGLLQLDAPLAIKIPVLPIAPPTVEADAGVFVRARPCWNPLRVEYACPIEVQAEALLSALASGLFTEGITPGTVVMGRAFVCPGPASERRMCMIQERVGVPVASGGQGGSGGDGYAASVESLPRFLDAVEGPMASVLLRARRIERAAVDICISALHTLAVLQAAFGLEVRDVRPANLLLKALAPGRRYFRGADTAAAVGVVYRWSAPTPGAAAETMATTAAQAPMALAVPNAGWLVKVGDMGMGSAYAVPYVRDGGAGAGTLEVAPLSWSSREVAALEERASDARDRYARLSATVGPGAAASMLTADEVRAIEDYGRYVETRATFGIEARPQPGYDPHILVASMAEACESWIGLVPAPIAFLRDRLAYTTRPGMRPAPGAVSPHGPLEALTALYREATAGRDARVRASLSRYLVPPGASLSGWIVVDVPSEPVVLSAPPSV